MVIWNIPILTAAISNRSIPGEYNGHNTLKNISVLSAAISKRSIPGDKTGQIGPIPIPPSLLVKGSRKKLIFPKTNWCVRIFLEKTIS